MEHYPLILVIVAVPDPHAPCTVTGTRSPISLRLLRGRCLRPACATRKFAQVRNVRDLLDDALHGMPGLAGGGRGVGVGDLLIHPRRKVVECALHEGALAVAGAEEGGVDDEEEKATCRVSALRKRVLQKKRPTFGERKGRHQYAEPQRDLEPRDEAHRRVVVLLDEAPDRIG